MSDFNGAAPGGRTADPVDTGLHVDPSSIELFRGFNFGGSAERGNSRSGLRRVDGTSAEVRSGQDPSSRAAAADGQVPPPVAGRAAARFPAVPGYEILGELGRGGMGVVYKARQLRLNRLVALKMILAGDHAAPDALDRLLAEAATIARIQHPHIVQVYAIGDCDGRTYIELEMVEGGSLASRLDGTPWPPRAAARLVENLARAVFEAHRLGIVHRDLKPGNILMTDEGEPKITDFGLAKTLEEDSGLTRTESILGSPSYMSPEQAEGRAKEVGSAADIYALGATLYELMTGRPPFVAPTILATLDLVKNSEPVPPGRLRPGVARDLETICLKCLQKEPHRRYESAEALAEDLDSFLNYQPIRARPTPGWERILKWVWRRPAAAGLILVSLTAVLAAVGGGLWYRAETARHSEASRRRIEDLRRQANSFVFQGQQALLLKDWQGASNQFSGALALIRSEPRLATTRATVETVLATCSRRIAEQRRRDQERARFARFLQLFDEAVFYQSDYTGLDPQANVAAGRAAARAALALFDLGAGESTGLRTDPAHYSAIELQEIAVDCYQLTLILAGVTSQPLPGEDPVLQARHALRILNGAPALRELTPAFHLRRAALLEILGDANAASVERRKAESDPAASRSAVDEFLVGEQAYRKQDLKRAIAAFRHVLSLQPDHFWAQYLLGVCQLKAHRPAEAQASLIACQSKRPGFVWTYLLKGFAEGEMREFDLAEEDFRQASELGLNDQERYVMLVNRGVMRIRRGGDLEAAEDLEAAIALKPAQFQAYINLAQAYRNLKRWSEAYSILDQAIASAPDQAVLFRARSQLYRSQSKGAEALGDLERAIALSRSDDPMLASDHRERGLILQQAGRNEEALAACDRALGLQPDRPDIHRLRGVVLMALHRNEEAIRSFDICLARGTPTPELYEARALALASRGSYRRAIADYTMALNSGRETRTLRANRGWAYLFSGAAELALGDFDAVLRLDGSDAHALSGRALAYAQLHKPREAVADARAASRAAPEDARMTYNAARVLCQAAAALEADSLRLSGAWNLAGRYRADALERIARSMELIPETERPRFWSEVVRTDPALEPVRRSPRYADLNRRFGGIDSHQQTPRKGGRR